jgi:hypothetical protein
MTHLRPSGPQADLQRIERLMQRITVELTHPGRRAAGRAGRPPLADVKETRTQDALRDALDGGGAIT